MKVRSRNQVNLQNCSQDSGCPNIAIMPEIDRTRASVNQHVPRRSAQFLAVVSVFSESDTCLSDHRLMSYDE
jgi:hypothetical protein